MVSVPNVESPPRARLRIGEWVADPATNELRRGDEVVRLEPRTMDVLATLAARAGQVVSREELLAAAWPGVVVGDEALSQAITKLRRALGDDPRAPKYVETISKRGYRLAAGVAAAGAMGTGNRKRAARLAAVGAVAVAALVAAWWLSRAERQVAPPAPVVESTPWITLTVLPFESLGAQPDDAYLARGIVDTLMTELGRLRDLRVISAVGATPAEAARRARYVVSGSVQRDAGALRVNVRLVDARSGEQLWSERLERPAADLFAVQDEVIRKLAGALPAKLGESERQRLARPYTRSLEAYDHFLRAQSLFLTRGARQNEEARAQYRQAIEADPRFARAYAGLAMTHAIEHRLGGATPANGAGIERALQLAETARQIDPDIAEVHWALGFVHAQARRHPQAIEALERAVELNPSFADAYALLGGIRTYVGEPAKSIPLLRTALRLKPEGGYLYYLLLGRAYLFEGDGEQALINLRQALARNPADLESRVFMAAAEAAAGDRAAAEWEAEEVRALAPDFAVERWLEAYPLASAAHRDRLRTLLAAAGLRARAE